MKKGKGILPFFIAALLFSQNTFGLLVTVYAREDESAGPVPEQVIVQESGKSGESLITQEVLDQLPIQVILKNRDGSELERKTEIIPKNQITAEVSDEVSPDPVWSFDLSSPEEMGFDHSEYDTAASQTHGSICFPIDGAPNYSEEPVLVFVQETDTDSQPAQPLLEDLETAYLVSYITPISNSSKGYIDFEEGEYSISPISLNEEGQWTVTLTSLIDPTQSAWGDDESLRYVPGKSSLSAAYIYENGSWIRSGENPITFVYLVIPEKPENELLSVNIVFEDGKGNTVSESKASAYENGSAVSDVTIGKDNRSAYVNVQITDPAIFGKSGYIFNPEKSAVSADYYMRYPASGQYDIRWIAEKPITLVFTKKSPVDENGNPLQPEKEDLNPQYTLTRYAPTGLAVNKQGSLEPDQFTVGKMVKNSEDKWSVNVTSLITPDEMKKGKNLIYMESESSISCTYIFEDGQWILPDLNGISYVYMEYYSKPESADLKINIVTEDQYGSVISSREVSLLENTGELSDIFVREEERKQYIQLNITQPEAYGTADMKYIPEKSELQAEYRYGYTDHTNNASGWVLRSQARLVFRRNVRQFADVSRDFWGYGVIANARIRGIMTGMNENEFRPFDPMTRGMAATVIYRLAGSPAVNTENPFGDVPKGTYYEKAIAWCYQNGIVNGYADGSFGPENLITRQQIAVMVRNYAQFAGKDVSSKANLSRFRDENTISDYARSAMEFCISSQIIHGAEGGTMLYPGSNATRAECAKIFLLASEL